MQTQPTVTAKQRHIPRRSGVGARQALAGRKVQRALMREAGAFRATAKHQRLVRRFGLKGAANHVPGVPVVNEHKDRTLAGKARRKARKADREIVAGFACSCGARMYLDRAGDRDPATRERFGGLYDLHAACDDYDAEADA